ncbi:flagellin [Rhizobium wenxiniae]|uniref:flagellin N-terminal helical domain-containing protein n=1 Tax=Rhizobium wenxiniae TaxID=1737357 RepID=UPI001C6EB08F|nr:flagellin [Rhizobium wenxiniae]MBW9087244.1 flagellin [Rhizobium wenxiniae]
MTSILTNASASAAISALRSINAGLQNAEGRVSSGLRVQEASDNVAYWSIATTMRSDNKAISAASDALGVGAAKVDVAYNGLESVIDVLSEAKAKLVGAKETSMDLDKIQGELNALKDHASGIARSASFSGTNWLNTDIADMYDTSLSKASVVSSFIRDGSGGVSVNQTDVDLSGISLINSTGGGILQKDDRAIGDIGGLRSNPPDTYAFFGRDRYGFTGPASFSAFDKVEFDITVDASVYSAGQTYHVEIDQALVNQVTGRNDGLVPNHVRWSNVLAYALYQAGVPATNGYDEPGGGSEGYGFISRETTGELGSSVSIANLTSTLTGGNAFGLEAGPTETNNNEYASTQMMFGNSFKLHPSVTFSFELSITNDPAESFTVTRDDVDAALGTTDGVVDSAADMAAILNNKLAGKGLIISDTGYGVRIDIDPAVHPVQGYRSTFTFSGVRDSISNPPIFDFKDIDITSSAISLDAYIDGVEYMIGEAISGGASLGAVQQRIEKQLRFSANMSDAIDSGIGRLVDADMEEESSRFAALQTQRLLAVQSLSMANSATQGILSLFES